VGSPIPPESLHACRSPDFDQGESRELLVRLVASRKDWMIFRREQTLAILTTDVSRVAVKIPNPRALTRLLSLGCRSHERMFHSCMVICRLHGLRIS
jgi:hypothetical protein